MDIVVNVNETDDITTDVQGLPSSPVIFITFPSAEHTEMPSDGSNMKITVVAKSYFSELWCINDHFGTLLQWSNLNVHSTSR